MRTAEGELHALTGVRVSKAAIKAEIQSNCFDQADL
jgi:hypothetical protein